MELLFSSWLLRLFGTDRHFSNCEKGLSVLKTKIFQNRFIGKNYVDEEKDDPPSKGSYKLQDIKVLKVSNNTKKEDSDSENEKNSEKISDTSLSESNSSKD